MIYVQHWFHLGTRSLLASSVSIIWLIVHWSCSYFTVSTEGPKIQYEMRQTGQNIKQSEWSQPSRTTSCSVVQGSAVFLKWVSISLRLYSIVVITYVNAVRYISEAKSRVSLNLSGDHINMFWRIHDNHRLGITITYYWVPKGPLATFPHAPFSREPRELLAKAPWNPTAGIP